jgi:hypothetical protein
MDLRVKLRHAIWKLFGRPDLPPKDFKVEHRINPRTNRFYDRCVMSQAYVNGITIERIAMQYNVTRERVRQMIWKSYRESIK